MMPQGASHYPISLLIQRLVEDYGPSPAEFVSKLGYRDVGRGLRRPPFDGGFRDIAVDGRSDEEITYHVMLLHEAGFIEAQDLTTMGGICWKPKRLTYSGHEFLDAAKSDTVWQHAKAWTQKTTGTLTLEGLKVALPHVVKALISGSRL